MQGSAAAIFIFDQPSGLIMNGYRNSLPDTPSPLIHFSPETDRDGNLKSLYDQLLNLKSLGYWAEGEGWLISRHNDLLAMMTDPHLRSIAPIAFQFGKIAINHDLFNHFARRHPYFVQQPSYERFKQLLIFFGREKIELLGSSFIYIADTAAEQLPPRFDLDTDYCTPAVVRMIACMLGVAGHDQPVFERFLHGVRTLFFHWNDLPRDALRERIADVDAGVDFLRANFARRRQAGRREAFVDVVLQFAGAAGPVTDEDLLYWTGIVIIDAMEKIILLASKSIHHVCADRRIHRQLTKNADDWHNAILEFFRYDCFVKIGTPRVATEDFVFNHQHIRKGDILYPLVGAAMLDERFYPAPCQLDINRNFNNFPYWAYDQFGVINKNLVLFATEVLCRRLIKTCPRFRSRIVRDRRPDADTAPPAQVLFH